MRADGPSTRRPPRLRAFSAGLPWVLVLLSSLVLAFALSPPMVRPGREGSLDGMEGIRRFLASGRDLEACLLLDEMSRRSGGRPATTGLSPREISGLTGACREMASALLDLGDLPAAGRFLSLSRRLGDCSGELHFLEGLLYLEQRMDRRASACFAGAVESDPSLARAWSMLAHSRASGDGGLLEVMRRLLARRPVVLQPYLRLGALLERSGGLDGAAAVYEAASELFPGERVLVARLARIRGRLQDSVVTGGDEEDYSLPDGDGGSASDSEETTSEDTCRTAAADIDPGDGAAVNSAGGPGAGLSPAESSRWDETGPLLDERMFDYVAANVYKGMTVAELKTLAGPPSRKMKSRLPDEPLMRYLPRPERWDYLSADGRRGLVVQLLGGKVTAVGTFCIARRGEAASPVGGRAGVGAAGEEGSGGQ